MYSSLFRNRSLRLYDIKLAITEYTCTLVDRCHVHVPHRNTWSNTRVRKLEISSTWHVWLVAFMSYTVSLFRPTILYIVYTSHVIVTLVD